MPPRSVIPTGTVQGSDRSTRTSGKLLERAMGFVSGVLFSKEDTSLGADKGKSVGSDNHNDENLSAAERERKERFQNFGKGLPRAWEVVDHTTTGLVASSSATQTPGSKPGRFSLTLKEEDKVGSLGSSERSHVYDVLRGCKRVVVIGVHGWFPGELPRCRVVCLGP